MKLATRAASASPLVELSLYTAALAGWVVVLAFGIVRAQIMWGAVCGVWHGKHKASKVQQRPDDGVASAARKRSRKKKRN